MNESENREEINECLDDYVNCFHSYFVDYHNMNNIIKYCLKCKLDNILLRPTLWKIFLNYLPQEINFTNWLEKTQVARSTFKKRSAKYFNTKKVLGGDPLGGGAAEVNQFIKKSKNWNSFYDDKELKKIIMLDINRTYQEFKMFQDSTTKEHLMNLLFMWSKENEDVSYKQGMNEILAVLYLSMHKHYFKPQKKINITELIKKSKSIQIEDMDAYKIFIKEVYLYLHDFTDIQADLYYLFDEIMKRGMKDIYDNLNSGKNKKSKEDILKEEQVV